MPCSLDVVIVNWNAGPQLRDCLASIINASRGPELKRVVVVDNASTDSSLQAIHMQGLPLVVLRNERNRGFAAACNQGASGSTADYLLFLNPDTHLGSDALAEPVAFMERPQNGRIGIVGIQ